MDKKASEHGRALAELGAAKGGRARADSMSAEERSEIGRLGAEKRWEGHALRLPKETHQGILKIGDKEIPCSVLDNGLRVLSSWGVSRAIGSRKKGASSPSSGSPQLPAFLASPAIRPFIPDDLLAPLISPVRYKRERGGQALGYEATLLPRLCEVILDAKKAGALTTRHQNLIDTAEILMRGFARVGIIALVDEATGYQADRARDELVKILEAYISKELLPWTKRFPDVFFQEIYRLEGWEFKEGHHKRPRHVGKLIKKLIYERLPVGVIGELERKNPIDSSWYRRHRHHQFLTADTGQAHLDKQITAVTTLMRVSDNKDAFMNLFKKAFPQKGQQLALNLSEEEN